MATTTLHAYRRTPFAARDDQFHRCLMGSALCGVLFLVAVMLAPVHKQVITSLEQLPPRFARLIVDKPKPPRPPERTGGTAVNAPPGPAGGGGMPAVRPAPPGPSAPGPIELPPGPRAAQGPRPGPGRGPAPGGGSGGAAGRARAQAAVSASLSGATASLERSLGGLSTSLRSTAPSAGGSVAPGSGRRARGVRAARSAGDLGPTRATLRGGGGGADLGGSAIGGSLVSVGTLSAYGGGGSGNGGGFGEGGGGGGGGNGGEGPGGWGGGGSGGGWGGGSGGGVGTGQGPGGGGGGSAPGVYRSNASLLAVVQRYAAGIQYCYANELKRDPTLSGKLVVAISVAASGEVVEAGVVRNTIGSARLSDCALSQIRNWRFPAVPEGVTTFQVPFVFTPPE